MVTEVEVLRALGEEPTARSLVRRRTDALRLLRSALLIERPSLDQLQPVAPYSVGLGIFLRGAAFGV